VTEPLGARDRLRAAAHDALLRGAERAFADHRRRLLAAAAGRTLEIGAGTGFNLAHYPGTVGELVVTDPGAAYLARARRRAAQAGREATFVPAGAEELPFADGSFDPVVGTPVLCSVSDQDRSLAEIRRVLRAGGRFLFCEHVRSDDPRTARWQDRLERPWMLVADGCHPNRPTVERIAAAPFDIAELERGTFPYRTAPILRPLVTGRARAR
jgi:ubiquinone/menaquinone biosynthesis C-methylase UbiE